jgi:prolyl oligopeptidase
MFLISRAGECAEIRPVLLYGYGGFDASMTPKYRQLFVPFLEAGGMVAVAIIRGGGEYGEEWHQGGKAENKQNVFDDFIAAANWLVEKGITTPQKLGINGRSNGGLLMGAMLTQRPDLFGAVLCDVPLLDMIRYHRFGFANIWMDEYGTADEPDQFAYLLKYSPYQAIKEGISYPAVLICSAENDTTCDPLHMRKALARLQAVDPNGPPKLGFLQKNAGHMGSPNVDENAFQKAIGMTFLMDRLGVGINDHNDTKDTNNDLASLRSLVSL